MTDQRPTGHTSNGGDAPAAIAARLWSRLAELARASSQTQIRLTKQSVEITWATLAGVLDRASANKEYVESMTREGVCYLRFVGELALDCATDFVALGKSLSATVLRETAARQQPVTRPASAATAAGPTRSTGLHVVSEGSQPPVRSEGERRPNHRSLNTMEANDGTREANDGSR